MELEKKYIYQVYVNGSFSKAAEALFVTQPALKHCRQEGGEGDRSRALPPRAASAHADACG